MLPASSASAALGRPEPVFLFAPVLLAALVALTLVEDPELSIDVALQQDRLLEGEDAELRSASTRPGPCAGSSLRSAFRRASWRSTAAGVLGLQLDPGVHREVSVDVSPERWGIYRVDQIAVRMRDRFGFFAFETIMRPRAGAAGVPATRGIAAGHPAGGDPGLGRQ